MLIGILRMPVDMVAGDPLTLHQFCWRARQAADRIESDAKVIESLAAQLAAAQSRLAEIDAQEADPQGWAELASLMLNKGHDYWEAAVKERGPGAVQWLAGDDGALFVFTRGEYSQEIVRFVSSLPYSQSRPVPPAAQVALQLNHKDGTATRFDLTPAITESHIRNALIELGWTPPAAQTVAPAAELAAPKIFGIDGGIVCYPSGDARVVLGFSEVYYAKVEDEKAREHSMLAFNFWPKDTDSPVIQLVFKGQDDVRKLISRLQDDFLPASQQPAAQTVAPAVNLPAGSGPVLDMLRNITPDVSVTLTAEQRHDLLSDVDVLHVRLNQMAIASQQPAAQRIPDETIRAIVAADHRRLAASDTENQFPGERDSQRAAHMRTALCLLDRIAESAITAPVIMRPDATRYGAQQQPAAQGVDTSTADWFAEKMHEAFEDGEDYMALHSSDAVRIAAALAARQDPRHD